MAKMPKEVMALLNERPLVPKVLSTCDATGVSSAKMYSPPGNQAKSMEAG